MPSSSASLKVEGYALLWRSRRSAQRAQDADLTRRQSGQKHLVRCRANVTHRLAQMESGLSLLISLVMAEQLQVRTNVDNDVWIFLNVTSSTVFRMVVAMYLVSMQHCHLFPTILPVPVEEFAVTPQNRRHQHQHQHQWCSGHSLVGIMSDAARAVVERQCPVKVHVSSWPWPQHTSTTTIGLIGAAVKHRARVTAQTWQQELLGGVSNRPLDKKTKHDLHQGAFTLEHAYTMCVFRIVSNEEALGSS